jgi:hypothetical protein
MTDEAQLTIDMAGTVHHVLPTQILTFGRVADVVVDDANPYLHRIVGRFFWHGSHWWLENLGRTTELELVADGGALIRLPAPEPDGRPVVAALADSEFRIQFTAGGFPYELLGVIGSPLAPAAPPVAISGDTTAGYGAIELTEDEHRMLLCLAEPCLRNPTAGPTDLPTNRAVADRLGWPASKLNRKLDYLCVRLSKAGVRGLEPGQGARGRALNRRWHLVEHAINARLVRPTDLRPR